MPITQSAYYPIKDIKIKNSRSPLKYSSININSPIKIDGFYRTIKDCYVFLKPKYTMIFSLYFGANMPEDVVVRPDGDIDQGAILDYYFLNGDVGVRAVPPVRLALVMGSTEEDFNPDTHIYKSNGFKYRQKVGMYQAGNTGSSEDNPYIDEFDRIFGSNQEHIKISSWFEPNLENEYGVHMKVENVQFPVYLGYSINENTNTVSFPVNHNIFPNNAYDWGYTEESWELYTGKNGFRGDEIFKSGRYFIQWSSDSPVDKRLVGLIHHGRASYHDLSIVAYRDYSTIEYKIEKNENNLTYYDSYNIYTNLPANNQIYYETILTFQIYEINVFRPGSGYHLEDIIAITPRPDFTLNVIVDEIDDQGGIISVRWNQISGSEDFNTGEGGIPGFGGYGNGAFFKIMTKEDDAP